MMIENNDVTSSVDTTAQTTADTSTTQTTAPDTGVGDSGGVTTEPPAYTPNFKYKYAVEGTKQAEAEIDDLFKPLIRDAETEKKIRELHEKAYGLDFIKSDRDSVKTYAQEVTQKFDEQTKALQTMGTYVKHKDYDSVFNIMGIPEQDVIRYALEKVQFRQMSPEQQQAYQMQQQERQRLIALEMQNQEQSSYIQQFAVSQREGELDYVLSRPEVANIASAFDQRSGMAGAFRNEVIRRGQYYAYQGYDAPAEQVVMEVANMLGGIQPQQPQAMQQPVAPQQKPVLPNITGKGTSPVKRVPKSIADLKQIAASMA